MLQHGNGSGLSILFHCSVIIAPITQFNYCIFTKHDLVSQVPTLCLFFFSESSCPHLKMDSPDYIKNNCHVNNPKNPVSIFIDMAFEL